MAKLCMPCREHSGRHLGVHHAAGAVSDHGPRLLLPPAGGRQAHPLSALSPAGPAQEDVPSGHFLVLTSQCSVWCAVQPVGAGAGPAGERAGGRVQPARAGGGGGQTGGLPGPADPGLCRVLSAGAGVEVQGRCRGVQQVQAGPGAGRTRLDRERSAQCEIGRTGGKYNTDEVKR